MQYYRVTFSTKVRVINTKKNTQKKPTKPPHIPKGGEEGPKPNESHTHTHTFIAMVIEGWRGGEGKEVLIRRLPVELQGCEVVEGSTLMIVDSDFQLQWGGTEHWKLQKRMKWISSLPRKHESLFQIYNWVFFA